METKLSDFGTCEICGTLGWQTVYSGRIRDGSFGKFKEDGLVAQCDRCGVRRLIESCVIPHEYYESDQYRKSLQQSVDSEKAFVEQDWATRYTHDALWPNSLRSKTIADIGCGAGSFLDTCRGQAAKLIAVEPCVPFQSSLLERGYQVFVGAHDAVAAFPASADLCVSIQVIEHVSDPVRFLRDIGPLLKSDGTLLITTPNRDDILGVLAPEKFLEFFYRAAHRWYFDASSLADCAKRAGYRVTNMTSLQKYGMSNMLSWLREGRPTGFATLPGIGPAADGFWKGYLQEIGRADTLCMKLQLDDSN
jgi:2-polyprenyl-3-methyl-5-hydroxy-6-metoxy-1,4-benzoquinol methylase